MDFETKWPGVFVVFEGIDGTGKSTQIKHLASKLAAAGESVVVSREPTDGPHGRRIRESASTGRMSPADELQALIQDRTEHLRDLVMPALREGRVVILDRYYFSTIAYQGAAAGLMESLFPRPDLVMVLDLDPTVALTRIREQRGEMPNEFERVEGLEKARGVFLSLLGDRVRLIDARPGEEEVGEVVWTAVLDGPIKNKLPGLAARLRK